MNQSNLSVTEQCHLCLFFQILMNVFLRRSHATEDRSVSTQSAPTSARETLSTAAEDTTSMMMAHAVLVRQKNNNNLFLAAQSKVGTYDYVLCCVPLCRYR